MTCRKEENKKNCACPKKTCENHGVCCACVEKHKKKETCLFALENK